MIKRTRRWKRNKEKKWMAHQGYRTYRSFMKFRNKSARYLIKTYKEVVGESEGTSNKLSQKISQKLPIVTTPRLFSFTMAFWAAAIVLTLTDSIASEYGDYFSLGLEAIFIDLVAAGILVGAISAFISTILAVYFYRRGWILSLSQRKPKRGATTPFTETIKNGFFYGIYGAIFMAIVAGIVLYLFQIPITYDYKTSFVSALAFLITYKVSFKSIHAVRNGDIV